MNNFEKLESHVFVTKLAGFEHTKYIQKNQTHYRISENDIPMVQGKNIKNGIFVEDYDWYISKEISDSLTRSKLNKECILIPYVGSNLGEVGIFYHPYDCHMASNIAKIELLDDYFDIEFLKYYLQSPIGQKYLFQAKQGSSQPNITMEAIRQTLILDFNKDKQKYITNILVNIDLKIQNNIKINQELESLTKIIFDYWFLQFEFPDENGKPYGSSGGKMLWNDELKRDIPEGWGVFDFTDSEICKLIQPGVELFDSKNYLATSNVNYEYITDGNWIKYSNRETRANMQPTKFSVWFAKMKNSTKHISIPSKSDWFTQKYILSTGFFGLTCNEISFAYVHSIVNSNNFEKRKDILAHGATQEAVNNEDLKNMKFVLPNTDILNSFALIINPILELKFNKIRENQELTSLRDFLLPLLMNGQIIFKNQTKE